MEFRETDLKKVMGNVFGITSDKIGDDTSIDTVATWDSLRHLNLVIALEERFNVTLTEDETVEILNYRLIKMILEKHGIKFVD